MRFIAEYAHTHTYICIIMCVPNISQLLQCKSSSLIVCPNSLIEQQHYLNFQSLYLHKTICIDPCVSVCAYGKGGGVGMKFLD